ncbi:hypothetical protein CBR_g29493 [Chara braunii]|uniref:Uncharacterized protein n=1 Tax=Chara braunii TaxID=69332 RepID=A0A388LAY6_CHABU|nr:hypothetical protein CBR_g29493 [Chara braunii]|eukprot:GBG79343.1 hypothetical protein CBR_g29493 [Chara braunii]
MARRSGCHQDHCGGGDGGKQRGDGGKQWGDDRVVRWLGVRGGVIKIIAAAVMAGSTEEMAGSTGEMAGSTGEITASEWNKSEMLVKERGDEFAEGAEERRREERRGEERRGGKLLERGIA